MKNHILSYNQINESNELDEFSFEETGRLIELGIIDNPDLIKIYNYVKNGSIGDLELVDSELTHLPNWLTNIRGCLIINRSLIEDIPDTLKISKDVYIRNCQLTEFNIKEVYGFLDIDHTQITKLPDGLIVHSYLSVEGIQFEQFPKDLVIEGAFYIAKSNLLQFTTEELREMYNIKYEINRGGI